MKFVLISLLAAMLSTAAFADRNSCREEAREDYESALRACDSGEGNGSGTCVSRCTTRLSNGNCIGYGADFCGRDAVCAANCTTRLSNGDCLGYAADFCGPNAECSENCTTRLSNGDCLGYGADRCFSSNHRLSVEAKEVLRFLK